MNAIPLETAAFIGNAGEMYFYRLSTQKSNICRKSSKVETIATSNLVATYLRPHHSTKWNIGTEKRVKKQLVIRGVFKQYSLANWYFLGTKTCFLNTGHYFPCVISQTIALQIYQSIILLGANSLLLFDSISCCNFFKKYAQIFRFSKFIIICCYVKFFCSF